MPKYNNKKTNGYASKREAKRAAELAILQKIGAIFGLKEQVKYELIPKQDGERSASYVADFAYFETPTGDLVVEDVKGMKTPAYILKRKLMLHVHRIKVREV